MKLKQKKALYGIIFLSRVGRRVISGLWRFGGKGENGELVFVNGTGDAGEVFKIPENEMDRYLIWEIS